MALIVVAAIITISVVQPMPVVLSAFVLTHQAMRAVGAPCLALFPKVAHNRPLGVVTQAVNLGALKRAIAFALSKK